MLYDSSISIDIPFHIFFHSKSFRRPVLDAYYCISRSILTKFHQYDNVLSCVSAYTTDKVQLESFESSTLSIILSRYNPRLSSPPLTHNDTHCQMILYGTRLQLRKIKTKKFDEKCQKTTNKIFDLQMWKGYHSGVIFSVFFRI